jgi:hypothetical protein
MTASAKDGRKLRNIQFLSLDTASTDNSSTDLLSYILTHDFTEYEHRNVFSAKVETLMPTET